MTFLKSFFVPGIYYQHIFILFFSHIKTYFISPFGTLYILWPGFVHIYIKTKITRNEWLILQYFLNKLFFCLFFKCPVALSFISKCTGRIIAHVLSAERTCTVSRIHQRIIWKICEFILDRVIHITRQFLTLGGHIPGLFAKIWSSHVSNEQSVTGKKCSVFVLFRNYRNTIW